MKFKLSLCLLDNVSQNINLTVTRFNMCDFKHYDISNLDTTHIMWIYILYPLQSYWSWLKLAVTHCLLLWYREVWRQYFKLRHSTYCVHAHLISFTELLKLTLTYWSSLWHTEADWSLLKLTVTHCLLLWYREVWRRYFKFKLYMNSYT